MHRARDVEAAGDHRIPAAPGVLLLLVLIQKRFRRLRCFVA